MVMDTPATDFNKQPGDFNVRVEAPARILAGTHGGNAARTVAYGAHLLYSNARRQVQE